jgi:membrane-associated HD superfamily phosphohydrolase
MPAQVALDWPELVATVVLIIGFAFALFSGNAAILYLVCFLTGLFFGRLWHKVKMSHSVPLFLAIMAFFLGFILGGIWANIRIITITLLAGILAGYWLHEKKIIRSF